MSTYYKQLTQEQRYQIYALKKAGHGQMEIANIVDVHKSTISRELCRNRGQRGYRPRQAHKFALARRQQTHKRLQPQTWQLIAEKLRADWSPEQISGWMRRNEREKVSHEWIYQYVLNDKRAGGDLHMHLRCQKKRRKRYGSYERRGKLPNRVSIDERPDVVDQRQRIGDWEVDTILGLGRQQAVVTLNERKSRLALLQKVERRSADHVAQAILEQLRPFADDAHTLTADNGKEFAQHETVAAELDLDFYFAHPYASWERGANENMNGLVRQYLPKQSDFTNVSQADLETIMDKLNHRPRKCLDFPFTFSGILPTARCTWELNPRVQNLLPSKFYNNRGTVSGFEVGVVLCGRRVCHGVVSCKARASTRCASSTRSAAFKACAWPSASRASRSATE